MLKPSLLAAACALAASATDAGTRTGATRIEIDTAIDIPAPLSGEVLSLLENLGGMHPR